MPIGSGTVSFSDIRTEFGGSGAVSISDYYRGTTNVRANAGNNSATNLAASVPETGALDFSDYRNTAKGFKKTYSATATNQDLSTVFGNDYAVDYPKDVVVNSGVEIGGESNAQYGIHASSGSSGVITITNQGTITGAGGTAGGAGGSAVRVNTSNVTFTNNGTLRGGGGAGGNGGAGGAGGNGGIGGDSRNVANSPGPAGPNCGGGCTNQYMTNSCSYSSCAMGESTRNWCYSLQGSLTVGSGGAGGAGGAGGNGGNGAGYGQSSGSGSAGAGGSSGGSGGSGQSYTHRPTNQNGQNCSNLFNAVYYSGAGGTGGTGGAGGSGGNGGGFGSSGTSGNSGSSGGTGSTGANGFKPVPSSQGQQEATSGGGGGAGSSGSSGGSGGAAGNALLQTVACTFINNGTTQGGTT